MKLSETVCSHVVSFINKNLEIEHFIMFENEPTDQDIINTFHALESDGKIDEKDVDDWMVQVASKEAFINHFSDVEVG